MKKNKHVYFEYKFVCGQYNNCAECVEQRGDCAWWFVHSWKCDIDDKLPKIEYEYENT